MNAYYIDNFKNLEIAIKKLNEFEFLGIDIETNGLEPLYNDILLIQIGTPSVQCVFDVHKLGNHIFELIKFLNRKTETTFIAHNAKFDYSFLNVKYKFNPAKLVCTMIGEQLLTQGIKKVEYNIHAVLEKYIGKKIDKEQQTRFIDKIPGCEFTEKQLDYAAIDVEYLVPLYLRINTLLKERGMEGLAKLEYETTMVTGDLETAGIYINDKEWLKLKNVAANNVTTAKHELDKYFKPYCSADMFGEMTINYNSPAQVLPVINKICKKTFKSTSATILKTHKSAYPVIEALLHYREEAKKISTYGEVFLHTHTKKDGRIHSNFIQLGARTGRYSSRNPNMTNIPRDQKYRTPFQAQLDDWLFISADFSQQELRLLVELSGEKRFIEAIEQNKDLHCFSASLLYDIPYETFFDSDGKIDKEMGLKYRTPAKSITFGLLYGMGIMRLAKDLNLDFKTAKDLLKKYFDTFPNIKSCMDNLEDEAKKNKYAFSPLDGRRKDLSGLDWDNPRSVSHAMNQSKNLPFQGAGASTIKKAGCIIRKEILKKSYDAKIVNIIHDSRNCHD